jgi:hypothetical protein
MLCLRGRHNVTMHGPFDGRLCWNGTFDSAWLRQSVMSWSAVIIIC